MKRDRCTKRPRGMPCRWKAGHRGKCTPQFPAKQIIAKFGVGELFDSTHRNGRFRVAKVEFWPPVYYDEEGSMWQEDEMIRVREQK